MKIDTALLIIDMQNAFCKSDGSYQKRGNKPINIDSVVENIHNITNKCRMMNLPIVYTITAFEKNYSDIGILGVLRPEIMQLGGLKENTWDIEIIDELTPMPEDIVIRKNRYDAFYKSNLDSVLKEKQVSKVFVTGVLANICVETTIRTAFVRGYKPFLIKECTTSISDSLLRATFENVTNSFGWILDMDQILTAVNSKQL